MKYIVLETPDGAQLPIIFPDMLTHAFVAGALQLVVDTLDPRKDPRKKDLRPRQLDDLLKRGSGKILSAGFVSIGLDTSVHGNSESLGLSSRSIDAARIVLGDSAQFLPDDMMQSMLEKLQVQTK